MECGGKARDERRRRFGKGWPPCEEARAPSPSAALRGLHRLLPGGCRAGSLREAIGFANAAPTADTIVFDPTNVPGTIVLTTGEILIDGTLIIKGPGVDKLTVSGNDASRIFNIADGNPLLLHPTTISGITLLDGNAGDGGAILSTETLTLKDMVIHSSYALNKGGGVNVNTKGKVTLTNVKLTDNEAKGNVGGGLYAKADGGIVIARSLVSGNVAVSGGGGMYLVVTPAKSPLTIDSSTFLNNNSGGAGGGVNLYHDNGGKVLIKNSIFTGNTAGGSGGALYLEDGNITVDNCVFTLNSAGNGGAIADDRADSLTIKNSKFDRNTASGEGGALYLQDFNTVSITGSLFSGNSSTQSGGAIHADQAGVLTVKSSIFAGNRALTNGGAISVTGFEVGPPIERATLVLVSSTVSGNSAVDGGGVFASNGAKVSVTGGVFTGNVASDDGGGIHTTGSGAIAVALSVTGTLFQGNRAASNGGGVFALGDGKVLVKGAKAIGNQTTIGDGGGMLLLSGVSVTVVGSLFQHNLAGDQGGGLSINLSTATAIGSITGSKFLDNFATLVGGGINYFSTGASVLTIKGSVVSGNVALVQGGGLHNDTNAALLIATVIAGNWAPLDPNVSP